MNQWTLYATSGVAIVMIALWALFVNEHAIRRIIAANLMGGGVFLVLVAIARRSSYSVPDPVPHALVLTGIVVSVSATGLALVFAKRLQQP